MFIPWEWLIKLEYISLFGLVSFAVMYLSHLFEEEGNPLINRVVNTVNICLSVFVLATPASISSYIIPTYLIFCAVILAYLLFITLLAFANKRKHSAWFALGYIPILICGINDILYSQEIINSVYILSAGLISFVLVNVILLTRIYSEALHSVKNLSTQLVEVNRNQEQIIRERTAILNEQALELESSNEVKDKIFSIISHDLRSPIKTLGAFLSIAVSDSGLKPEELKLHLKKIQRDTEVLSHTLENILMWSRSQIKEVHTRPVDLDLHKVARDVIDLYRMPAEAKHITIESTIEERIMVHVDKDHLNLVLRNLTGNALKFTHSGGLITISAKAENNMAQICVSDMGIGMSPEQLEKVFKHDSHYTTYGTTNEKGTGLGLLLCKEYIEKNNGSIWVESEVGKGTSVFVNLPCSA